MMTPTGILQFEDQWRRSLEGTANHEKNGGSSNWSQETYCQFLTKDTSLTIKVTG